jgi:hypothetical protein
MHNIDEISRGRARGWVKAGVDGCPAIVTLTFRDREVRVYATVPRRDVFMAGHSLFSGFDIEVSAPFESSCKIFVGNEQRDVAMGSVSTHQLVVVDSVDTHSVCGWINHKRGLDSLALFHNAGFVRAEVFHRPDVNNHLSTGSEKRFGFQAFGIDFSEIHAIKINNSHIHWLY